MIFPAGNYFIGDLCYLSTDFIKDWNLFLEHTNYLTNYQGTFDSRYCGGDSTYYGDGTYYDYEGNEYCVDSGSIGIMQIKDSDDQESLKNLGRVCFFEKDFQVKFNNGVFKFGNITINTKSDDDY